MSITVALLGIYHESNTFVSTPTTLAHFRAGHYLTGQSIIEEYRNAHHEIGGMIEVMEAENITLVPVFYAEAVPGGTITDETYAFLLSEMLGLLNDILPVDGCLVAPHGAAVSESEADMDGHWLKALRTQLGKGVPIIGTLDPHANVSEQMVSNTDALVSYKTNPHVDQRETGRAAARLMAATLRKQIEPEQILLQLPMAISIEQQYTSSEPCKSLYDIAHSFTGTDDIVSLSINLGFPYADVQEMGTSLIVVSDNNPDVARIIANSIAEYIIDRQYLFVGKRRTVAACFEVVDHSPRPVLMLDMGDNVGGGAPGNSTVLLEAAEFRGNYKTFICLHDPQAAAYAASYTPGDEFVIRATNQKNAVLQYDVKLLYRGSGRFSESMPRHGGQVNFDMGEIAIVVTRNNTTMMLTTHKVSPFSLCQLTSFGIHPEDFDIIVAKGVNAPVAAYSSVCPTILQVDTPGPTQADMTAFEYRSRRKPLFPFETITENILWSLPS